MRKVKLHRANETVIEPLSENAKDIKRAIKNDIPTEHIFSTNVNATHEKGTNKYIFKFPEIWRNIVNQELIIGVRQIYLNRSTRYISYSIEITIEGSSSMKVKVPDSFVLKPNEDFNVLLDRMNNKIKECYAIALKSAFFKRDIHFRFHRENDIVYILTSPTKLGDINENNNVSNVINDSMEIYCATEDMRNLFGFEKKTFTFPDVYTFKLWDRNDVIEVTASFVKQTESQHLGYSGTTYNPIKYYKIDSSDQYFWIELAQVDAATPIELPNDDKDSVAIEAVLLMRPLK